MKLLRCAVLPAILASLALSSCSGQTTKAVTVPPSPIAAETPSPIAAETPAPQANTFDTGLAKASDASYGAKTAETPEDWDLAVARWQQAIKFMQGVPKGSANYAQAQQKLVAYQRNLTAAHANHAQAQQKLVAYQRSVTSAQSYTAPKEAVSEPVAAVPEPESKPVVPNSAVNRLTDAQRDQVFLLVMSTRLLPAEQAWASNVSNQQKIALAHSYCKAFDRGTAFQAIALNIFKKAGANKAEVTYMVRLVGAAIGAYCPQHRDKVPS